MTIKELYAQAKMSATPAQVFVTELANITKKSEITVRRWLSGETVPDTLTRSIIAKHFNSTEEELFPNS